MTSDPERGAAWTTRVPAASAAMIRLRTGKCQARGPVPWGSSVSKAPAAESFREIEAGIGTDSYQRVTFDLNQAVNDAVAFRINGLWHDAGVAGRDEVYDERAGIAVAVGVSNAAALSAG